MELTPGFDVALRPRDVHFDWTSLPVHWIPNEPFATHMINVLHLLLPAGERWFVHVLKQALPLIHDDRLREDVIGFIGQEAIHARSHDAVLDRFDSQGLDVRPYTEQIEWMFQQILGDRELEAADAHEWLVERLGIIAAVEHFTAFLGQWILDASALDTAGTDPTVLDLLRWHGAEEVEHRSVAFDLACHLDPRYRRRLRAMALSTATLTWLWIRGVRYLMKVDPVLAGTRKARWRDMRRTGKLGLTPSYGSVARTIVGYLPRNYHPSQHGSTDQAVAYLASSPAARAAA